MSGLITSVVVSYQIRPEAFDEHVGLIKAIFDQLNADRPDNVEYKVVCLEDGVSFVHISTADTSDGSNPLPQFEAFREFGANLASRVATSPAPSAAEIVGSYQPAGKPLGAHQGCLRTGGLRKGEAPASDWGGRLAG